MSEANDYRLERWIAAILFLLFFLPFVANADEILFTDLFHGDQIKAKSGESYLALVCNEDNDRCCMLVLDGNGLTQVLATFPALDEDGKLSSLDVEQYVVFAGDLDHDGKLDLLANIASRWNEWRPALYLSKSAREGELVGKVAELLVDVGC